jgi:hypothetical protein
MTKRARQTKPVLPRPHGLRPPENFAVSVWASLQSGYALRARRPDTGIPSTNPAELPLIDSETVFRQTRPPQLTQLQINVDLKS